MTVYSKCLENHNTDINNIVKTMLNLLEITSRHWKSHSARKIFICETIFGQNFLYLQRGGS